MDFNKPLPERPTRFKPPTTITVGVLALQGAFIEHQDLLTQAAHRLSVNNPEKYSALQFQFVQVRTKLELSQCAALILPGGESTAMSLIAERCGMLEPLREFIKLERKPVWGTCAGLILLAESANKTKATGQQLLGGLDVRVQRNYFGRQVESFEADLDLEFLGLGQKFRSVFIRAPVVEKVLTTPVLPSGETLSKDQTDEVGKGMREVGEVEGEGLINAPPRSHTDAPVEILGRLPGRAQSLRDRQVTAADLGEEGDIVAVKQGNAFGTAFHPELTRDPRIHMWWLEQVVQYALETGHGQFI